MLSKIYPIKTALSPILCQNIGSSLVKNISFSLFCNKEITHSSKISVKKYAERNSNMIVRWIGNEDNKFTNAANVALSTILDFFESCEDDFSKKGFDIETSLSSGVLTVKIEKKGTYVINKQTPTRQIWVSSPLTGPIKFDQNLQNNDWVCSRNNQYLSDFLSKEISEILGKDVKFQF
ncbi:frataxin [Anaeramoeba ignava]|uniref:ferroxidase n=1 Tax=Anaeramoeba ignava TaxID=1746090 RepID=A0A9Q0RGW8_ANAIG|nr:frataxin [Anaeramoeba ignava]